MEFVLVVVIVLVAALVLARRAVRAGKRRFEADAHDPCASGCERCPVHDVTGRRTCGSFEATDDAKE